MVESGVKMLCDIREGQQMLKRRSKAQPPRKELSLPGARLPRCYRFVKTIAPTPIAAARLLPTGDVRGG